MNVKVIDGILIIHQTRNEPVIANGQPENNRLYENEQHEIWLMYKIAIEI